MCIRDRLAGMSKQSTSNVMLRKNGSEIQFDNDIERESLSALGIDSSILFEHVGGRIGQELTVKLQHIKDDLEFWNAIIQEWSEMGMGEIEISELPPTKIIVKNSSACGGSPSTSKFLCDIDESVLSGILLERHGRKVSTSKRECIQTDNCSCFYEIIIEE